MGYARGSRLIIKFLQDATYEIFMSDEMMQSAVERQLEIIGEAARQVTPEFRQAHPDIPWRSLIGLRNVLIHQYGEVNLDRLWTIAFSNVPGFVDLLDRLISPIDDDSVS